MRVGLFIPCYVDQLAPDVGMATVRVLEKAGCEVDYDPNQTCCGQPFLNMGAADEATKLASRHLERFAAYDTVVCPSGSCTATVRHRYPELGVGTDEGGSALRARTFELGEFLVRVSGTTQLGARFEHRVALLESCHGLRDLGLGTGSEQPGSSMPSPAEALLAEVEGLTRIPSVRDECCGFGGTFAVKFPEVSSRMGRARMKEWSTAGAEYVTGTDVSCLLHLDGIRRREGIGPKPIHLAELLAHTEEGEGDR